MSNLIIRLKSENGTLKCEFTEMNPPELKRIEELSSQTSGVYEYNIHAYNNSFQPITLSEEAREYLYESYPISIDESRFTNKSFEFSGKSTECFEVKVCGRFVDNRYYELHLKSVPVAENVEEKLRQIMNKHLNVSELYEEDAVGCFNALKEACNLHNHGVAENVVADGMKSKLLIISEETLLERMFALQKNITDSVQDEEKKQFYIGQYASLDLVLSLSKPLVMPSDEEVGNQSIVYSDDGDGDWDEIISEHFSQGAKFVIDKINNQLEKIK